jgi:UDP-N-acetylenolpyruvoylglucosamine reductase
MKLDERVGLARLTTIGTGGPARWFAKPGSVGELHELLRWAQAEDHGVETIGLGSNVLVHDEGVDALVLKLTGSLAEARVEGTTLVAGGGATNAVCLHRARDAGLAGFEFAAAIPGTIGGGVRMNAGAWGCEFREVLVDATVVDANESRILTAAELDLAYRRSALGPGEVVAQARLALEVRDPAEIKASVAALLEQRRSTQPTNKRTFGSVFKNPSSQLGAGRAIERSGLKGYQIGGARISPVHANFIENAGGATSADALALMAEARKRVHERFGVELEHEVRFLGPLVLPRL